MPGAWPGSTRTPVSGLGPAARVGRRRDFLAVRASGSVQGPAGGPGGVARALALLRGSAEAAAQLLSCVEGLGEQIGVSEGWVGKMNELTLAAIHSQVDAAAFATAWEEGRKLTVDEAIALALSSLEPAGPSLR